MKKVITILGIVAVVANGCGQRSNRQTAAGTNGADTLIVADTLKEDVVSLEKEEILAKIFLKATDYDGIKCEELQLSDEDFNVQDCAFPSASMQQVYDIVKKNIPYLKQELPAKDTAYYLNDMYAAYQLYPHSLFIELDNDEGAIQIGISEDKDENTIRTRISYSIKTETDEWEGVKSREYIRSEDDRPVVENIYPNANLKQVYDILRKTEPVLRRELPTNNTKYSLSEENTVTYKYLTRKHLIIDWWNENSGSTLEIIEKNNETKTKLSIVLN